MKYYVLDTNFTIVDGIELYSSMIWTDRYYEPGEFEVYTVANEHNMELFKLAAKEHYYIVRADDDLSSMRGMIVSNISLDLKKDGDDYIIVTGRSLEYILHRRISTGKFVIAGELESEVQRLIRDNAIEPKDPDRIIPTLELGPTFGIKDIVNADVNGQTLDEIISSLCKLFQVGWRIRLNYNTKRLVFEMYKGINRSYSQDRAKLDNVNAYVVFSDQFDNLLKTAYNFDTDKFRNVAYVQAEYDKTDEDTEEVTEVDYTQVVTPIKMEKRPVGLDRFELYVDGSSVNKNYAEDLNAYRYLLETKGRAELKKYEVAPTLQGEVLTGINFEFDKDYFMGDLVSIINPYGQRFDARVTELVETHDTSSHQLIPSFSIEWWDGKPEEEDTTINQNEVRLTDEIDSDSRITENGVIRLISTGYEYTVRFCPIMRNGIIVDEERVTEDGRTIDANKSDYIKDL